MRFNEDNINDILDKYKDEAIDDYVIKVFNLYFENASEEYKSYSTFNDELLKEIFFNSTFNSLINDDLHYVLDKYPEYWAIHIINEVNNTVDFHELRKIEDKKLSFKILEEISGSWVNMLRVAHTCNYLEPRYVKRKKDFLKNIGLKSISEQSPTILAEKIVKYTSRENRTRNKLPTNILEKEVAAKTNLNNEYLLVFPLVETENALNDIEIDIQTILMETPTTTKRTTQATCKI